MNNFDWSLGDRIARLTHLWQETGLSMTQISAMLGTTRGSVAKRIQMLGLPKRRPNQQPPTPVAAAARPVPWREGETSLPPLWSQMTEAQRAYYGERWGL